MVTVMEVCSGKDCVNGCARGARVQVRMRQGKSRQMKVIWPYNRATLRRSGQRRDVPERIFANVAMLKAMSQRFRD